MTRLPVPAQVGLDLVPAPAAVLRARARLAGSASPVTRWTASPGTSSRSRLVASTRKSGQDRSNRSTRSAQASTRCSQLSSKSRTPGRCVIAAVTVSTRGSVGCSRTPSPAATVGGRKSALTRRVLLRDSSGGAATLEQRRELAPSLSGRHQSAAHQHLRLSRGVIAFTLLARCAYPRWHCTRRLTARNGVPPMDNPGAE
jgi:hypothetical protein